jgi:hypothetical protein
MSDEPLTPGQQMEQAIGKAIRDAISEFDKGFVVKWVAAVEILDGAGDRGVWSFTSENAKRWDIFGMLKELEHYQQASSIADFLREM